MIAPPDRPDGRTPDSMCEFYIYMTGFSTDFRGRRGASRRRRPRAMTDLPLALET